MKPLLLLLLLPLSGCITNHRYAIAVSDQPAVCEAAQLEPENGRELGPLLPRHLSLH